jgi:hypothetical protein
VSLCLGGHFSGFIQDRLVNITYSIFVKKFFDKNPGMAIDTCMNFAAKIIAGWLGRKKIKM